MHIWEINNTGQYLTCMVIFIHSKWVLHVLPSNCLKFHNHCHFISKVFFHAEYQIFTHVSKRIAAELLNYLLKQIKPNCEDIVYNYKSMCVILFTGVW